MQTPGQFLISTISSIAKKPRKMRRPPSQEEFGGFRLDGSPKGDGYFGKLTRPDGGVSTELSVGTPNDPNDPFMPLLVPTLTKSEIDYLLSGNKPTESIYQKALSHYRLRQSQRKSVWALPEDRRK